jgi:hypothetical protein
LCFFGGGFFGLGFPPPPVLWAGWGYWKRSLLGSPPLFAIARYTFERSHLTGRSGGMMGIRGAVKARRSGHLKARDGRNRKEIMTSMAMIRIA